MNTAIGKTTGHQGHNTPSQPTSTSSKTLHHVALIVFACLNIASIGIFFAVFAGLVFAPPDPRARLLLLVAGSFAFAILAFGQFFHWSRLALRALRERRS